MNRETRRSESREDLFSFTKIALLRGAEDFNDLVESAPSDFPDREEIKSHLRAIEALLEKRTFGKISRNS